MQDETEYSDPDGLAWERAFDKLQTSGTIARSPEPGSWFMYRPGRLVVDARLANEDSEQGNEIRALLRGAFAEREKDADGEQARGDDGKREDPSGNAEVEKRLSIELYRVPREVDLPELAQRLAHIAPNAGSLDHYLVGDPHRFAGSEPPMPIDKPGDIPGRDASAGKGLTCAVLDTGLWKPLELAPVAPGDEEVLDEDTNDELDPPAGHGTFVTGIIRRYAPSVRIVPVRVLKTAAGIASEVDVAKAILGLPPVDVINLSFGGPTQGDAAPYVIERALAHLSPGTVVVAAAGNEGVDRPHWPAASKRVFGVGSVEGGKGSEGWDIAPYSNRGWWVDVAAPGTNVHSTFVSFEETGSDEFPNRTFKEGARWSGTSFATPKVAGAILALASRDNIPVREAAYRLIEDPVRQRIIGLGTLVVPRHLPPAP